MITNTITNELQKLLDDAEKKADEQYKNKKVSDKYAFKCGFLEGGIMDIIDKYGDVK